MNFYYMFIIQGARMKSFFSLIPKYMFKSKKRVWFIAIGLIVSTILITSIGIITRKIEKAQWQYVKNSIGGIQDVTISSPNFKKLKDINKNENIDKYTISLELGKAEIPGSSYQMNITGYDKMSRDILNFKLIEGRYPQKENEIALEQWVVNKLPSNTKIGDKIKIPSKLDYRTAMKNQAFERDNEFILVGTFSYIFDFNVEKSAQAYVTREYVEKSLPDIAKNYKEYLIFKSGIDMENGFNSLSFKNDSYNESMLLNYDKKSFLSFMKFIKTINIALYIIIIIMASVLIYNLFNISIIERIKDFGVLRAIGAEPNQIITLILGEGIVLGIIFIPIGIATGYIVTSILVNIISGYGLMTIEVYKQDVICCLIVGFISILVGSYFPARQASKISPMVAINSNSNLKLNGATIKNNKNSRVYNKLGFTGKLAYTNLKRNKKKFVTTIISIGMSLTLIILVNYFTGIYNPVNEIKRNLGGDFSIVNTSRNYNDSLEKNHIKDIENLKGIKSVNAIKEIEDVTMEVKKENITDKGIKYLENLSKGNKYTEKSFKKGEYYFIGEKLTGYDRIHLKEILSHVKGKKISLDNMDREPLVVLPEREYTNFKPGDKINIIISRYSNKGEYIEDRIQKVTIAGVLDKEYSEDIGHKIIMSNDAIEKYLKINAYQNIQVSITSSRYYEQVNEKLNSFTKHYPKVQVKSFKQELSKAKKSKMEIYLVAYSFVLIASLVSIVNIISVMNTNIFMRKSEFGMFRAIGMENNQIRRMVIDEGVFYGIASVILGVTIGLIFSAAATFLVNKLIGYNALKWGFSSILLILLSIATIGVCVLSSIFPSRQIVKGSIIDSIRTVE